MVRKQILWALESSKENLLENVKPKSNGQKLVFNILYYPVFQNVRRILYEFCRSLKDELVGAKLPNVEETKRCQACEKRNCCMRYIHFFHLRLW